jgi:hypothetical protein
LIGLLVDRQAYQFHRRWRRPALDSGDPGGFDRRRSSRRLKFSLPSQDTEATVRSADIEACESEVTAWAPVALGCAAYPIARPAGFESNALGHFEKGRRSGLASAISVHPLAHPEFLARAPRGARKELSIRHDDLAKQIGPSFSPDPSCATSLPKRPKIATEPPGVRPHANSMAGDAGKN